MNLENLTNHAKIFTFFHQVPKSVLKMFVIEIKNISKCYEFLNFDKFKGFSVLTELGKFGRKAYLEFPKNLKCLNTLSLTYSLMGSR